MSHVVCGEPSVAEPIAVEQLKEDTHGPNELHGFFESPQIVFMLHKASIFDAKIEYDSIKTPHGPSWPSEAVHRAHLLGAPSSTLTQLDESLPHRIEKLREVQFAVDRRIAATIRIENRDV